MTDRAAGAVTAAVGVALLVAALRLPEAMMGDPAGPRLLPVILAAALTALGVALAAVGGPGLPPGVRLWGGGWRLAAASLLLFVYAFLLEPAGYLVATAGVMLALLALYNPGRPLVNGAVAVGFSLASYYVFHVLLGVYVPRGLLG
jgi:putative tricarboxylic transport membrane protein